MSALSRSQLVLYGGMAAALLLVGARWIRSTDGSASVTHPEGEALAAVESPSRSGGLSVDAAGGDVVVHVAGAVVRPGVYRLPSGSRVTDAVERAGGPLPIGDANAVNLAARLADGQQVVIPRRLPAAVQAAGSVGAAAAADAPISLGGATLEQLDTIEGIGPVTAQNILDFRDEQGGLTSIEELDEVPGIGPATMEALRARLQP